ncbi:MAG TPA: winged helix DNA-binding domain-containing protein [Natronosporangium sp.]
MLLDRRTLNRALLDRQLLLRRHVMAPLDAVRHLIGLQAQAPTPPYYGLWSRLARFDPAELSGLLERRSVVRATLLRGTIHLVAAEDCLPLHALLRPLLDRLLLANPQHATTLADIDRDKLAAAGRELLSGPPLTGKALGERLAERWPDRDGRGLAYGVQYLVPVVQAPPRGLWGRSGQPAWVCAEAWLGQPATPAMPPAVLVRRYLAAFGPASVADLQHWSGLTNLGEVVKQLPLRTFRDEHGRTLYDVDGAPLPDPDTPAPVRFVAPFDNLLLSHADRTRIISDEHRPRVFTVNGIIKGTVLVDGFVAATWRLDQQRKRATLTVEPFGRLSSRDRAAVEAEGTALLEFAAPTADHRELLLR